MSENNVTFTFSLNIASTFSFSVISKLPVLLFVCLRAFIKLHMHCNTEDSHSEHQSGCFLTNRTKLHSMKTLENVYQHNLELAGSPKP